MKTLLKINLFENLWKFYFFACPFLNHSHTKRWINQNNNFSNHHTLNLNLNPNTNDGLKYWFPAPGCFWPRKDSNSRHRQILPNPLDPTRFVWSHFYFQFFKAAFVMSTFRQLKLLLHQYDFKSTIKLIHLSSWI